MARTQAHQNFLATLPMATELMRMEREFKDPPKPSQQLSAQGLRGAAAVLMVAAFEAYLDDMIEEKVQFVIAYRPAIVHNKLPDGMRVHDVFESLSVAMKGPKYGRSGKKVDRIAIVRQASALVAAGTLNPSAFSGTAGNPGKARELFKRIGLDDVFGVLKPRFETRWGQVVAPEFIGDKLDEIVQRRHRVAHRADALMISRADLKEGQRFLRVLAEVLDIEAGLHTRRMCRVAR